MWKYLFFIFLFFVSCKKEKQKAIQTIYPLAYLPVYPGSKWTYINESGDTIIQSTAPEYQLHQYESEKLFGTMTDNVYVPYWNGKPIYGYSTPLETTNFQHYGLTQVGYLSEKEGEQRTIYSTKMETSYRIVENIDTSITVNSINYDNVIIVHDYSILIYGTSKMTTVSYYAKNIGLIKEDHYSYDGSHKYIDIVSYYINK